MEPQVAGRLLLRLNVCVLKWALPVLPLPEPVCEIEDETKEGPAHVGFLQEFLEQATFVPELAAWMGDSDCMKGRGCGSVVSHEAFINAGMRARV